MQRRIYPPHRRPAIEVYAMYCWWPGELWEWMPREGRWVAYVEYYVAVGETYSGVVEADRVMPRIDLYPATREVLAVRPHPMPPSERGKIRETLEERRAATRPPARDPITGRWM